MRRKGTKKTLIAVLLFAEVLIVTNGVLILQAGAAQQTLDKDIELLRKDIRSQVKQLVAANMQLTAAEAEKFWPVYDQYAAEMEKINDVRLGIIKQYAEIYDSLNDADALSLTKRWMEADDATVQMAQKYLPLFGKVLPGRKVARFMQIDRRLRLLIDVQVSSQIPLAGEKLIGTEGSMPDHHKPGGAGTTF
jgi:hypothetical protein